MFEIRMELEKIPKSNLLNIEEKKKREETIKALNEEYQVVKKQLARLKFEERKNENAKHKRK